MGFGGCPYASKQTAPSCTLPASPELPRSEHRLSRTATDPLPRRAMGKATTPPSPPDSAMDVQTMAAIAVAVVAVLLVVMKLAGGSKKKFLNKTRQQVTLGQREQLSHDTVRFRFLLPKSAPVLGLPVCQHFKLFCPNPKGSVAGQWNGREDPEDGEPEIERKYTRQDVAVHGHPQGGRRRRRTTSSASSILSSRSTRAASSTASPTAARCRSTWTPSRWATSSTSGGRGATTSTRARASSSSRRSRGRARSLA